MTSRLKKIKAIALPLILFTFVFASGVFAQVTKPKEVIKPKEVKEKNKEKSKKTIVNENDTPAEKSIAVDAKVNISFCVSEGKLRVNGWERNEIRAFVSSGGSQVGFKILQKSKQTDQPVWVMVLGFDPSKNTDADADECLSAEEIELDVPRNAIVNIKSRESEITVESVGKARVENVSGDIFLNNIAQGIDATTYQGDVTVENSSGAMTLFSTTGNVVALDVSTSEVGDIFKAKTSNGAIILKNIEQRQIDVGSNSGSINFTGEFFSGGVYNLGTQNGSIILNIPQNSSCKINAAFGFGAFNSDIPLLNIKKNPTGGAQNLTAQLGKGEANLNLTTYNGKITIKKK